MVKTFLKSCNEILGTKDVSIDHDTTQFYGKDTAKDFDGKAEAVLFPRETEQVQKLILAANEHKASIIPSGGRTGLCGGATATNNEYVLSLDKMNKILDVSKEDQFVICQPGVKTHSLKEHLSQYDLTFPIAIASEGSSQIGGNIATNAGGMHVISYGSTRNWILGLEVVCGDGTILNTGGKLYKNQTGYDIKNLFVGSEGTLGIITEATIALTPLVKGKTHAICAIPSYESFLPILALAKKTFIGSLSAIEFFEYSSLERVVKHHPLRNPFSENHPVYLLIEIERDDARTQEELESFCMSLIEQELALDVVIGQSPSQGEELLNLREYISETLTHHYSPHKNDISVPISKLPEFIEKLKSHLQNKYPEVLPVLFGHIGDGNIHVNLLKPENSSLDEFIKLAKTIDQDIYELVALYEGSISAEHGIGLLKRDYLPHSKTQKEIDYMKKIKKLFDPNGILNPGKIFEASS